MAKLIFLASLLFCMAGAAQVGWESGRGAGKLLLALLFGGGSGALVLTLLYLQFGRLPL